MSFVRRSFRRDDERVGQVDRSYASAAEGAAREAFEVKVAAALFRHRGDEEEKKGLARPEKITDFVKGATGSVLGPPCNLGSLCDVLESGAHLASPYQRFFLGIRSSSWAHMQPRESERGENSGAVHIIAMAFRSPTLRGSHSNTPAAEEIGAPFSRLCARGSS
ncbi:hypothetical protein K504DRAFT_454314 [Pleomassaria siparia CBS 279.74]|uniref:Uncharacterized protein n=1 Tax=Pleomassaria siparia CBS 279.74 TaxID=1314801 RepID=A0A6G1KAM2_9PLEO|nr:hypothetical protein K504DRAFT_454314 [Pleomassaria siparia CBS 279.74]